MDIKDSLLHIRINYKKQISYKRLKKAFYQAYCFNFQSNQTRFQERRTLKKELNEELITVAWYPNRLWDWCVSKDEEKELKPVLLSNAFNVYNLRVLKSLLFLT